MVRKKITQEMVNELIKNFKPFRLKQSDKGYEDSTKAYEKLGFYPEETWDLDETLAIYILPRLCYFRDTTDTVPQEFTDEEWKEILDKIVWSFYTVLSDDSHSATVEELSEKDSLVNEGLVLFGKCFGYLWN